MRYDIIQVSHSSEGFQRLKLIEAVITNLANRAIRFGYATTEFTVLDHQQREQRRIENDC